MIANDLEYNIDLRLLYQLVAATFRKVEEVMFFNNLRRLIESVPFNKLIMTISFYHLERFPL